MFTAAPLFAFTQHWTVTHACTQHLRAPPSYNNECTFCSSTFILAFQHSQPSSPYAVAHSQSSKRLHPVTHQAVRVQLSACAKPRSPRPQAAGHHYPSTHNTTEPTAYLKEHLKRSSAVRKGLHSCIPPVALNN
ncbi:uncharacterized protein B0T23DRAFT_384348 [Neurospora hispaniola]|uniref:Uncharacterized protein n=1 Tax=Neurospora hispaniola TaxID=588809 RepID=A0AAJ0I3S0_9PEZI|nr:hypothetical protein B0T23DRAFT_384348 [Neurospora hispaniola]